MKKRAIIVHGWDGYPEEGWFPWLKQELEAKGFEVLVPQMPQPEEPRINNWVPKLAEVAGRPNENLYLIGHSLGCQTIARYLADLPKDTKIGGAVFVAGFFKRLTGLGNNKTVKDLAKQWLETPVDLKAASEHMRSSVAIFSDNDPFVPLDNQEEFANVLGSKIVIESGQKHFSGNSGTTKMPKIIDYLLKM